MQVFVLDKNKQPLMPTSPARARKLLKTDRAVVTKRIPFSIRLKDRAVEDSNLQSVRLKFDPGSKATGIALIRDDGHILHLAELHHKQMIKKKLDDRRAKRRRRRTANIRYRPPRFDNRSRPKGWLPPSLQARVDNIRSWCKRYMSLLPLTALSVETVRFDTQKLQNPEISGVEYQRGTLFNYEVKEYLLEKWGRKCVYCGARNVPLQIEHIIPKSRGGTNRVSNLTLSCGECNQKKKNKTAKEFGYPEIQAQAKKSLKQTAIVNATRWRVWDMLNEFGLPVEMGTGGRTKFNRSRLGIPKRHALDAACVGKSTPDNLNGIDQNILIIRAVGRGRYQRTTLNKYGFPRGYLKRQKHVNGIKTGDLVRANILTGKGKGTYIGHCVIRHNGGQFRVKHKNGEAQGHRKYFELLERSSGYELSIEKQ